MNPNSQSSTNTASSPNKVERVKRSVIERKLLTVLGDDSQVACLFTKQDLEDIIASLYGYKLSEQSGNVISWKAHVERCKGLADGMSQLLREAFPGKKE